ncbi:MAG: hypothetical protein IJ729_02915, partial [Alloprevotella sp.]|nr:hypothetical protein [Alloprevotella sp.]
MRNLKICVTVLAACLWIFTATDAAAQKSDTVRVGDETYWGLNEDSLRRKGEQRILEDYKFTNNLWFQFLAGVYNNWGSNQKHHFGLKHFRPSVGIAAGKWFHPTVGARIVLDYGNNRGVSVGKGIVDPRGYTIQKGLRQSHHWHTVELAGDAMINLSNLFFRYNENRVFNFIVFFGIGGNQTFGFSDRERAFSLEGGYDSDTKQQYEGYQKDNCTLLTFRAG